MADGFILLDKPPGYTSHQVVTMVRKILNVSRAGHTGTLDPMATGLLIVAVGKATRLIEYLMGKDKCYHAEITFGTATDTEDSQGKVLDTCREFILAPDKQQAVLDAFRGKIKQVPPAASAIKIQGQRAYDLFRRGATPRMAAREVEILRIEPSEPLTELTAANPRLNILVCCSKGTYIRSLARDMGEAVGIPAHLSNLRRVSIGSIGIDRGCNLDQLAADPGRHLQHMTMAVHDLPRLDVSEEVAAGFCQGQKLNKPGLTGTFAVYCQDVFMGIGQGDGTLLKPRKVFCNHLPNREEV